MDTEVEIVGESKYIENLKQEVANLAKTDLPVLICGETGSGKDVVAKLIHRLGPRKNAPYVPVNCPALGSLAASELFGHSKGSFTGADQNTAGYIGAAEGGSLFLDEIGNLSHEVQAMLLRFLENKEYVRVGEARVRHGDVRILSAANDPLERYCEENRFRWDLFYRISGAVIETAPLRKHKEDIPLLARYFLTQLTHPKKNDFTITSEAYSALFEYDWPGNIRQLRHVVQYAAVRSTSGQITLADIETVLRREFARDALKPYKQAKADAISKFEIEYFSQLLTMTNGRIKEALQISGLHKKNFYTKIRAIGISPSDFRSSK